MNAQEIIEKLEKGEYEIEYTEECNCNFWWHIKHGELDNDEDGNECWTGNALYVDGELIAEYIRFDGWKLHCDGLDLDDLPDKVSDEMLLSETLPNGWQGDAHRSRMRETLVDFLMEGDYELGRDDDRGFANEYTMTLRELAEPENVSREEAEEWADDYMYDGDAATEAFVGFALID